MEIPLFYLSQTEASVGATSDASPASDTEAPTVGFEHVLSEVREALVAESVAPENEGETSTATNAKTVTDENVDPGSAEDPVAESENAIAAEPVSGESVLASDAFQARVVTASLVATLSTQRAVLQLESSIVPVESHVEGVSSLAVTGTQASEAGTHRVVPVTPGQSAPTPVVSATASAAASIKGAEPSQPSVTAVPGSERASPASTALVGAVAQEMPDDAGPIPSRGSDPTSPRSVILREGVSRLAAQPQAVPRAGAAIVAASTATTDTSALPRVVTQTLSRAVSQGDTLPASTSQPLQGGTRSTPLVLPQVPPQAAPQVPPQAAPQVPPQAVPQVPPQAVPQVPPQAVPQVPPQATPQVPQVPPQATPQVPPQAAPQVPPQAVPQVPPQATPQVPPQAAPQVLPQAVLQSAQQPPVEVAVSLGTLRNTVPGQPALLSLNGASTSETASVTMQQAPTLVASSVTAAVTPEVLTVVNTEGQSPPEGQLGNTVGRGVSVIKMTGTSALLSPSKPTVVEGTGDASANLLRPTLSVPSRLVVSPPSVQSLVLNTEGGSSMVTEAVAPPTLAVTTSTGSRIPVQPVTVAPLHSGVALESGGVASAPQAVLAAEQAVLPKQQLVVTNHGPPMTEESETVAAVSASPNDDAPESAGQTRLTAKTLPSRSVLTFARSVSERVVVAQRGQVGEQTIPSQVADPVPSAAGSTETMTGGSARAVQDVQPSVARQETLQQMPQNTDRATLPTLASKSADHVRLMIAKGERSITVRLVPESLGRMQIEVRSIGNEVSIRIVTANVAVREAFDAQVSVLRDSLARDGIHVSRVDVVSTTANGTEFGARSNTGGETFTHRRSPQFTTTSFVEGNAPSALNDRTSARVQTHAGLDVLV